MKNKEEISTDHPKSMRDLFEKSAESNEQIKISSHLENLKFSNLSLTQKDIELLREINSDYESGGFPHLEDLGLDLSKSQEKALFTIQTILSQTNYKGNILPKIFNGVNDYKYKGEIPRLKVKIKDYLTTYGVNKCKTKRGYIEFSGKGRSIAVNALKSLANKNYPLIYSKTDFKKKEKTKILNWKPLLTIEYPYHKPLEQNEINLHPNQTDKNLGKLYYFIVTPSPIIVDQIEDFWMLKEKYLYQKIDEKYPKISKAVYCIVDYIIYKRWWSIRKAPNKPIYSELVLKRNFWNLSRTLRMNNYFMRKDKGKIINNLETGYKIAQELGYLKNHSRQNNEEILYFTANLQY